MELMMKKDLFMHLRVSNVFVPSKLRLKKAKFVHGNRVLQELGTIKRVLGKSGKDTNSHDGVTVAGIRVETENGIKIHWGVSIVRDENFNRREGCDKATKFAVENSYVTENMTYEEAKVIADTIGQECWKHGYVAMDHLFTSEPIINKVFV